MGWILRTKDDVNNPVLAGGVYGRFITIGRAVYYTFDGAQTRGIILIADGGKYGLDRIDSFEYKGEVLVPGTNWIFHRGTLPVQIEPWDIVSINAGTDVITVNGHPYTNGQLVRFGVSDGSLSAEIDPDLKYQIANATTNTFKIKDEAGTATIDLVDVGSGAQKVWLANAGRDDPDQGWPTFCPETQTTFSRIAYIEFKLPTNRSDAATPPDWQDFRAVGTGQRLMDYDVNGAEVSIVNGEGDDDLLANVALQIADNMFNNIRATPARMHWASWFALRNSAATQIWQRIVITDDDPDPALPSGFSARYYQDQVFTNHKITRTDATINMTGTKIDSPAPGVTGENFSVRWIGQIRPEFTELYTLEMVHDDTAKVWINGQLLINAATPATSSAPIAFIANRLYNIQVEMVQIGPLVGANQWTAVLKWSSASQPLEIIPADRIYPEDSLVLRYECHTAFPFPVEASEVHERLMDRCPGWHWTDRDGRIEFLSPDRPIAFGFAFDRVDDDSRANFVKGTFTKKRRPLADRRNFLLFRYRNVQLTGFPFGFVQADREDLRRFTNGEPTNDPATDLGVSTRSLAERIGENEMIFKSDPTHTANLSGGREASKLRKNELVTISYYDVDGNFVADATYMITFHSWGARNDKNDFILTPITLPFYTDEPFDP